MSKGEGWRRVKQHGKRDANEGQIIDTLELLGCSVTRLGTPCDLLVGYDLRTHLVEVKVNNEGLTPAEAEFVDTWKGESMAIVRTEAQARKLVGDWQREAMSELAMQLKRKTKPNGVKLYPSVLKPAF